MGLNLSDIANVYNDEAAAYELMELLRWPDGPVCPHCQSDKAYFLQAQSGERKTRKGTVTYRRVWKCAACRRQFSVLVGTVFEGSHIPLGKWLMAIHEMCTAKNGVAAYELHRKLGITNKSAWFMTHRIRWAMGHGPLAEKLDGVIEADETYFGPTTRNLHADQRKARAVGPVSNKVPVHVGSAGRSGPLAGHASGHRKEPWQDAL